jgi:GTP pyrophosphokinase
MPAPTKAELRRVDALVEGYEANKSLVLQFQNQLLGALAGSSELARHVHSIKSRLKDPARLRDKLLRQIERCKIEHRRFDVELDNLLTKINDLAGIRILHLYTRQIRDIDAELRSILEEQRFALMEGPFARTWDDESRAFLKSCGIETQESPSLYTSVHYVVSSASRTTVTCEIQVRTLMEEVWGEVDHNINYPHQSDSLACREQLKVLARVTSSATRLVDSIFLTFDEHRSRERDRGGSSLKGRVTRRSTRRRSRKNA